MVHDLTRREKDALDTWLTTEPEEEPVGINPNDITDSYDDALALLRLAKKIEAILTVAEGDQDISQWALMSLEEYATEAKVAAEDIRDRARSMKFDLDQEES